ncbi:cytochrome-c oxidase [Thalassotalea sp. 42_200_T64]|nr:cytochrome-c oxidase [Thalassotalea sp. 42_200_T64]
MPSLVVSNLAVSDVIEQSLHEQKLPGDLAMWFFILMELTVFAIFFIGFAITQRLQPEMFIDGRATLSADVGLFCTLALIISSYFVARSVEAVKRGNNLVAKRQLVFALLTASIYIVLKITEYSALVEHGFDISTNTFYTLYFFITGFHFMHVLLGMIILAFMAKRAKQNAYQPNDCSGYEAGATYWHMVDLVWVIVFFLIYIIH